MKKKLKIESRVLVGTIVILFPVIALAQVVATSTVATSTPDTSLATTTITTDTATASSSSTDTTKTLTPLAQVITSDAKSKISNIASLEDSYGQKSGKYLQILPGEKLPLYEVGSVTDNLGADVPTNARVDVYAAPSGNGYQITYQDTDGTIYSVGYGPEAKDRTYTTPAPQATASTTPSTTTQSTPAITVSTTTDTDNASGTQATAQ